MGAHKITPTRVSFAALATEASNSSGCAYLCHAAALCERLDPVALGMGMPACLQGRWNLPRRHRGDVSPRGVCTARFTYICLQIHNTTPKILDRNEFLHHVCQIANMNRPFWQPSMPNLFAIGNVWARIESFEAA